MSTLLVALLLIGFIVAICLTLTTLHNRQQRKATGDLLRRFSEAGERHGLSISSQEVLPHGMIGLDGRHRQVLLLGTTGEGAPSATLVPLAEVTRCSVKKQYAPQGPNVKGDLYLQRIVLLFEGEKGAVELPFFDHLADALSLAPERERRARHWEEALSKLTGRLHSQPA